MHIIKHIIGILLISTTAFGAQFSSFTEETTSEGTDRVYIIKGSGGAGTDRYSTLDTISTYLGSGNVSATGSPVNDEVGVWTDGSTIEGQNEATFKALFNMEAGTDYQAYDASNVTATGSPSNDEVGVWTDGSTLEGMNEATFKALFNMEAGTDYQAYDANNATTSTKLDDFATPDDNTDLDATTGQHGLLPKLGGGSTNYLRADGTWAEPPGGDGSVNVSGTPDAHDIAVWTNATTIRGGSTTADVVMKLGDNAGAYSFVIKDSDGSIVFEVDSDGSLGVASIDPDLIEYTTLNAAQSSDDTYTGTKIVGLNAGEAITQWDAVFLNDTDSEYHQADADASGEWPCRGIAVASAADGSSLTIISQGIIRNDGWTWSGEGSALYLSDTAGGITETAPSTSTDCAQLVGWTISDDEAYINISGHYVVVP